MLKIKLLIFDLDGVLVDSRKLHYDALNLALKNIDEKYVISLDEHRYKYDGLPTKKKLQLLTTEKGLNSNLYEEIWKLKQEYTNKLLNDTIKRDDKLINIFSILKKEGYIIYCASNSIWNTIKTVLLKKEILSFIDYFISNEEVKKPKPSPEIYLSSIIRSSFSAQETLIFEDSPVGLKSAKESGAHVCHILDPDCLTIDKIFDNILIANTKNSLYKINKSKKNINIVIPMAGHGSRFLKQGYTLPKPLINVNGKCMIELVIDNINTNGNYIFIARKEHCDKYNIEEYLHQKVENCSIIQVDKVTEGAACTVLLAKDLIDNDNPLLIVNSDQILEWESASFLYEAESEGIDGCISTFELLNGDNKWSYARLDLKGNVVEVKEKEVISNNATTGIYYWKKGSDYVKYALKMIQKNIRVNNEFYVCPVYNEAIQDGKNIKISNCKKMWGLGTPEDLEYYLNYYKSN
jgi:HAD superfamily hydrolase (TIGR01509 family)